MEVDTTVLLGAISALGGVVTFLWRQIMTHYNETKQARDECDEDRKKLWKALYAIHPACKEIKDL